MLLRPRSLFANPTPTLTAPVLLATPRLASQADSQNGLHFVWSASRAASLQISQECTCIVHSHLSNSRTTRLNVLHQCSRMPLVICPDLLRQTCSAGVDRDHALPKREKVRVPARFKVLAHRGALRKAATKDLQFLQHLRNLRRSERQRVFDLLDSLGIHKHHPTYTHPQ